jgi:hypothetical protein
LLRRVRDAARPQEDGEPTRRPEELAALIEHRNNASRADGVSSMSSLRDT